jgi:hypothetical protein
MAVYPRAQCLVGSESVAEEVTEGVNLGNVPLDGGREADLAEGEVGQAVEKCASSILSCAAGFSAAGLCASSLLVRVSRSRHVALDRQTTWITSRNGR